MAARKPAPVTGKLSARLLQLKADNGIQPYVITDDLVVTPPTKARGDAMQAATVEMDVAKSLLMRALGLSIPRPASPGPDSGAEQWAAWAATYESAMAAWRDEVKAHNENINDLSDKLQAAESAYQRAFFGDAHDRVMDFFSGQHQALWDAFADDIRREFLPPQPDNGVCPTCGHVDEEQAGKAPESST